MWTQATATTTRTTSPGNTPTPNLYIPEPNVNVLQMPMSSSPATPSPVLRVGHKRGIGLVGMGQFSTSPGLNLGIDEDEPLHKLISCMQITNTNAGNSNYQLTDLDHSHGHGGREGGPSYSETTSIDMPLSHKFQECVALHRTVAEQSSPQFTSSEASDDMNRKKDMTSWSEQPQVCGENENIVDLYNPQLSKEENPEYYCANKVHFELYCDRLKRQGISSPYVEFSSDHR